MNTDQTVEWTHPLMRRVGNTGGMRAFWGLMRMVERGEIIIPEWQRGRVWTQAQKSAWCGFVLSRMPLPAIWIRQVNADGRFRDELVDGQQRISALLDWLNGEIPAVLPWNGSEVWCTSELDRRRLARLAVPCMELPPSTTDAEVIDLYLALNTAGTPHTTEELERARKWLATEAT